MAEISAEDIPDRVEYVIHLAGYPSNDADYRHQVETNNSTTGHLLDVLEEKGGVEKIAYASTGAVYSGKPPFKEGRDEDPKNFYGEAKYFNEKILGHSSIDSCSLRLFDVVGPETGKGVIPIFVERAVKNKELKVFGGKNVAKDFVSVDAVGSAFRQAVEKDLDGSINVGTGKATKIYELAEMVIELTDSDSKIVVDSSRDVGSSRHFADTSKMNRLFDLPETRLKRIVSKVVDRYEEK